MTPEELASIQGNVVAPYGARFTNVAHLFGRIDANNAAAYRRLLRSLREPGWLTWGQWREPPEQTLNVGLSFRGLQALRAPLAAELADRFAAFAAGMPARAASLGDTEAFDRRWEDRHVWLSVHASTPRALDARVAELKSLAGPLDLLDETRGAAILKDNHRYEHFGFRDDISYPAVDGLSQPSPEVLEGRGQLKDGSWHPIEVGEFLLGFPNNSGTDVLAGLSTAATQLLHGGSFAVLRRLRQDVVGFRDYVAGLAGRMAGDPAARLVGRERGGAPLAPLTQVGEGHDALSNFTYEGDKFGAQCPLGAHVRRANPRVGGRHRLMRRGMSYGEPLAEGARDQQERGLWFLAFNADIEDQFEFVQKRWLNGPVGTLSDARDPITGAGGVRGMAIEGDSGQARAPVLLLDIPEFVTCSGGQYYFYPGSSGIELLAAEPSIPPSGPRQAVRT